MLNHVESLKCNFSLASLILPVVELVGAIGQNPQGGPRTACSQIQRCVQVIRKLKISVAKQAMDVSDHRHFYVSHLNAHAFIRQGPTFYKTFLTFLARLFGADAHDKSQWSNPTQLTMLTSLKSHTQRITRSISYVLHVEAKDASYQLWSQCLGWCHNALVTLAADPTFFLLFNIYTQLE